jgi:glycosyltransferase involved in cell wall biosynthesis
MKAGMIGLWMQKRWRIPYIISEQSSMYSHIAPGNFYTRNFFHRARVKKIFRRAIAVTNVSETVGKTLKRLFDLSIVRTIHNTVNTGFFNYKEIKFSKFRFVHVSTLSHQKNVEGMLRTIKRLSELRKDFEVVIVGPLSPALLKMIDEFRLSSVVSCTGEITYPEVAGQMQNASAFIMFSRHENFPCVVIEALCCGLPVIATDVGGVAEAIDNSNGMIVPSESEEALMESMIRMMNEYQKFDREKIALQAREKYSYDIIGAQFYKLYGEILGTN